MLSLEKHSGVCKVGGDPKPHIEIVENPVGKAGSGCRHVGRTTIKSCVMVDVYVCE